MNFNPKYLIGKIVGLAAGWAIGGWLGAIIGGIVGAALDKLHESGGQLWQFSSNSKSTADTDPNDFIVGSILLAAVVVKSDGEVEDLEMSYVRTFLVQQFGTKQMDNYWTILEAAIEQEIDTKTTTLEIRKTTSYETRLQLIHFLFGIANADFNIDESEIATIKVISLHLGIHHSEYESIKAMFYSEMDAYYKILGLSPSVSDNEVKHAHRQMLKKYHPDKLAHLGEGVRLSAQKKFLKVQKAYEHIKRERGFK